MGRTRPGGWPQWTATWAVLAVSLVGSGALGQDAEPAPAETEAPAQAPDQDRAVEGEAADSPDA